MKRATEYCGLKAVDHNVVSGSFSLYAQVIWRLSIRSLAGYLRPGKKSKGKSQARYEQQISHSPVINASKRQAADKPGIEVEEILPTGALTEIRNISLGEQCRAEAQSRNLQQNLQQMLPALASFCQQRWLVLVAPPCLPSIDELKKAGIDPARVLLVHSDIANGFDVLEQTLRSGTCGAVLAWLEKGDAQTLDCLRQAAEAGNTWGVLFRATKQKQRVRHARLSAPQQREGTQLKMAIN
ncbi:MAG: hypothetical protein L3J84_10460 [Gammaproteobacteria bacterium]|nr:hypothetical protein [Gammaproteobacteria bacterium]